MSEYSKKTVADLTEILKTRGLPVNGKKADLIARLTEADKANQAEEPAPEPEQETAAPITTEAAAPAQDEIVIEDTAAAAESGAANGAATATIEAETEEAKTFALNLKASDIESEMAKRQARAARFNTGGQANADAEATETATADTDAQKKLERAQRFGTGTNAIGKLDQALSSERVRGSRNKNGGGAEGSSSLDDPGLKQGFSKRGGGRFGRNKRGGPGKPTGVSKPGFSNEKDRAAAEARKKRFAAS